MKFAPAALIAFMAFSLSPAALAAPAAAVDAATRFDMRQNHCLPTTNGYTPGPRTDVSIQATSACCAKVNGAMGTNGVECHTAFSDQKWKLVDCCMAGGFTPARDPSIRPGSKSYVPGQILK